MIISNNDTLTNTLSSVTAAINEFKYASMFEGHPVQLNNYSGESPNALLVLINLMDDRVMAIRSHGDVLPTDYIFTTSWLPVSIPLADYDYSDEEVLSILIEKKKAFLDTLEKSITKYKNKNVLFPVTWLGENDYMAFSPSNEKMLEIFWFKKNKKNFAVRTEKGTKSFTHNYWVYLPSREGIQDYDLTEFINPTTWEDEQVWDKWSEKDPLPYKDIVPEKYRERYIEAINIVNSYRSKNLGNRDSYLCLAKRLKTFERLVELKAPVTVIQKQFELVNVYVDELTSSEK
jgi:hypothetical protein